MWVFGLFDTSHKPALGVMQVVTQSCAAIYETQHRSGVMSGGHTAMLAHWPIVPRHQIVNHSLHFKDPVTGVHTEHIESYWNWVKTKLKRMKGYHCSQLPLYLDEFMWFERHGTTSKASI